MVLPKEMEKKKDCYFSSLRLFLYSGWFWGMFPVNFDRNLKSFHFKLFSLTSFFSLVRIILLLFALFLPLFFLPNENKATSTNLTSMANESAVFELDPVSEFTFRFTGFCSFLSFIFPFVLGGPVATLLYKMTDIENDDEAVTFSESKLEWKTACLFFTYSILLFCGTVYRLVILWFKVRLFGSFFAYWIIAANFFTTFSLRSVFTFYEVLFIRSMRSLKGDITRFCLAEYDENLIFRKCGLLCRKMEVLKDGFSVFLLLDISFLTISWILR